MSRESDSSGNQQGESERLERELEQERTRVQRLESLGVLAGGIAHDFNNMLMGLQGNLALMGQPTCDADLRRELLEEAELACDRAQALTQQLLTFARGSEPALEVVHVGPLVEASCGFALRGANTSFELSLAAAAPVEVDIGQLDQVIGNLVLNAAQATPFGGCIRVAVDDFELDEEGDLPLAPGPYVRISVRDRGVGILPADLPRIFDPYFTTKERGTGLGLASAHSIVRKHGGCIAVESEPGIGSTFSVYLPAHAAGMESSPARTNTARDVAPGRVLVMDDDPLVGSVAKRMLESLGWSTTVAVNGAEALRCCEEAARAGAPFDLALLDLTVPGELGGLQTLQRLRGPAPDLRAVVMSGYANDPVLANYRARGFQAVLAKPFRIDGLRTSLHEACADAEPAPSLLAAG